MDSHKLLFTIYFLVVVLVAASEGARLLQKKYKFIPPLSQRLQLDGNSNSSKVGCWESMFQLQSCTSEVIVFFLNGETFLGPECCDAIRVIENQCWPALLSSLGFTFEETDVLRHYCDAAAQAPPPPPHSAIATSYTHRRRHFTYGDDEPERGLTP